MPEEQENPLTVDLSDPRACLKLLTGIKHTRLEGLAVEHEADQLFFSRLVLHGWRRYNGLVLQRSSGGRFDYLLEEVNPDLTQMLRLALSRTGRNSRRFRVAPRSVDILDNEHGEPLRAPQCLVPKRAARVAQGDPELRRLQAMYWGIASHMGNSWPRFMRGLIVKDWFIDQISRGLHDVDCLFLNTDGGLLVLEVKHKYPMVRNGHPLFGMNVGEISMYQALARAGASVWHVVLVKPRWTKDISSTYLFFDREAREHALWIAADLTKEGVFDREVGSANAATSLYATGPQMFRPMNTGSFRVLGTNDRPSTEIGQELLNLISGHPGTPLDAAILKRLRLPDTRGQK